MTEQKIALYQWIDACPEACFSYQDENTLVIEIELEKDEDDD